MSSPGASPDAAETRRLAGLPAYPLAGIPEVKARLLAEGRDVIDLGADRGALLVYDNAYAEIAFDGFRPPSLLEVDGGLENGLEFHSFSKSFNMTGWRLGWACGGATWIQRLARVKSFFDTGPYLPIQAAGAAVLQNAEAFLAGNVARLAARRDAAVSAFEGAGFTVTPPRATLYLRMPVPTRERSVEYCRRLLESEAVVLLPGSALGEAGEGFVRAAFTVPVERYAEAAERAVRLG
jgi:LL-diaminopimelate aminotransferase